MNGFTCTNQETEYEHRLWTSIPTTPSILAGERTRLLVLENYPKRHLTIQHNHFFLRQHASSMSYDEAPEPNALETQSSENSYSADAGG